jgi:hypothetical protein
MENKRKFLLFLMCLVVSLVILAASAEILAEDSASTFSEASSTASSTALSTTLSKNGNAFSSATGSYATSSHCTTGTCGWISGNQAIVGVYSSDSNTWGGSLVWNFDLSFINLDNIDRVDMNIKWPAFYGKGLHSPLNTGEGKIKINNEVIADLITNKTKCGSDYFSHDCGVYFLSYNIPKILLSSSNNNIEIETSSKTGWDVGVVELVLYENNRTIKIMNGKILINNIPFLIKGMDYAPWIKGTGPEPSHQAFPYEYDDVTSKVNNSGVITVKDYSGDGKIQAWEVIRYDMEIMKSEGVNTVRIYSSGSWHDRNMNNIFDAGELVQGDVADWVIDRIIMYAKNSNMKVIIGYWVQEEDMIGDPPVCNMNDLNIAKLTIKRVVNKYKNENVLLGWAIGNEVHLGANHEWFNWGVDINDYLNQLNDYLRSLDSNHPIIYSKYVGEDANFNNLNADIIAVNAFTHSASELVSSGVFDIPAPSGKAYMLGEFGHIISQADEQWNLSKQYAGGCFLENNDVWWKPDLLGTTTQFREKKPERFEKVVSLFGGILDIKCSSSSQCGVNSWVGESYCVGKNKTRNYLSFQCVNAGKISSYCKNQTQPHVIERCSFSCSNGECVSAPAGKKSDLALFKPSTGEWFIAKLTNGKLGNAIAFGKKLDYRNTNLIGGIPVSGDYNGDDYDDLAIFDNSKKIRVKIETTAYTMWDISSLTLDILLKNGNHIIITKNGNQYSSFNGSIADSKYYTQQTCSWIIGNQIVLGHYANDYPSYAVWDFNIDNINIADIAGGSVSLNWVSHSGKGLHSTSSTGQGIIKINEKEIARMTTNVARCGSKRDYFAHSCRTESFKFNIPAGYFTLLNNVEWYIYSLKENRNLLWHKAWGSYGSIPVSGDYNRDGIDDLAVWNKNDGKWYIVKLNNDGTLGNAIAYGVKWGDSSMTPVPGDYDGDGKYDLALFKPSTGEWYIAKLKSDRTLGAALAFGVKWGDSSMTPVSGDYDGDGKYDLALFKPSTGEWYIAKLKSDRTLGAALAFGVKWGDSSMTPVSGDYDSDGKYDLALFQSSSGKWYIAKLKSDRTLGAALAFCVKWGDSSMTPVPGDYDSA